MKNYLECALDIDAALDELKRKEPYAPHIGDYLPILKALAYAVKRLMFAASQRF